MRDETSGSNLIYIDDSGCLGLGSLPNSGQAITVQGNSILNKSAQITATAVAGFQRSIEGTVSVAGSGSATVAVTGASQQPALVSTMANDLATSTAVRFVNPSPYTSSAQYTIW